MRFHICIGLQTRTSKWLKMVVTLFSTFIFTKMIVTIVTWKTIHVYICLWPTLPHMTHFSDFTIITETQIWNWILSSDNLKQKFLRSDMKKCSAKTRLNFETTTLPTTLIQIQVLLIVEVNYQLPLVSGQIIKSKSVNRSQLRDLTALLH